MSRRGVAAAVLVAVAALLGGCEITEQGAADAASPGTGSGCTVDGVSYEAGESFPSADGCNTCGCGEDGQVACTLKACVAACSSGGVTYLPGETWDSDCNTCTCEEDGSTVCTTAECIATCEYEGSSYAPGDSFPAADGCNTCTCQEDGAAVCTEIGCIPVCEHDGQTYSPGESFPAGDGCNSCMCQEDGFVACTLTDCMPVCEYGGETYVAGETFPATDGCNTCTCEQDGTASCTEIACAPTCEVDGTTYSAGESFPAADGCNTCSCQGDGTVLCTMLGCASVCVNQGIEYEAGDTFGAGDGCGKCECLPDGTVDCASPVQCTCEPADGEGLHYVGKSPDTCAVIDFACPPETTYFANECGCGCEQAPSCPDLLDCSAGATDTACSDPAFADACPYTIVTGGLPACCTFDAECGGENVCAGGQGGMGVCKLPAAGNACWSDGECDDGLVCVGGWTCPCNADCDGFDEPGTCAPAENECTKDADCGSGICTPGPLCTDLCAGGDPACCFGNTCEPACAGLPFPGCSSDDDCDAGSACVTDGSCHASICGCSADGTIYCTEDCQPGACIPLP